MRHPLVALMWEIWQPHRAGFIWMMAAIPVCAMLYRLPPLRESGLLRSLSFLPMAGSLFFLFIVFKFTESDRRNRASGFPSRLFTLPVCTWLLVTCPMASAVVAIIIAYLCWAKLVFAPLGETLPVGWPCLYLGASMLSFQAIVWTLAPFRLARLLALGVCGTVIATSWLLFRRDMFDAAMALLPERWAASPAQNLPFVALAAMGGAAWCSALVAVKNQRLGGGERGRTWRKALDAALYWWPWQREPFASAARAQAWLEWRRQGMLLPSVVAAIFALIMLPTFAIGPIGPGGTMLALTSMLAAPLAVAAALGKGFGKLDLSSTDLAFPPFLAVRPVRSERWVAAKLKVAAWSVATTWLLVVVAVPVWVLYRGDIEVLIELWQWLHQICGPSAPGWLMALLAPVGALLSWRMLVAGLWVGMWGKRTVFLGSICFGFALVFCGLQAWLWFQSARPALHHFLGFSLWLPWLLNALFVTKVTVAVWTWHSAIEQGAVTANTARRYFAGWLVGTGFLMLFVSLLVPDIAWLRRLLIFMALLALPLARIGLAVLAVNQNRTR